MNTKNILLGLSLILSLVATLNFTSCQSDDDDDANHAPKSLSFDFSSKLESEVKSLLIKQLNEEYVMVREERTKDNIVLMVVVPANKEKETTDKLVSLSKTEILALVRKSAPQAQPIMVEGHVEEPYAVYEITYDL